MKNLLLFALLSASVWGQGFVDVKDWSTVRIRLEHTPCSTPCSVFSIEIAGDGTVEYNGQSLVAVLGKHRDRIERGDVESILGRLRGAEAYALKDENGSDISNLPGRRLSWSIDGVEKSVLYADGDQLKAIADLVKSIERRTQIEKWVFGTADTITALRAEGFDLKSEDAGKLLARVSYWGNTAAVRDLIAAGAPLNVRDSEFCPIALECALYVPQVENTEVLQLLISAGASRGDQATKDRALVLAKQAKAEAAERLLRDYGARD